MDKETKTLDEALVELRDAVFDTPLVRWYLDGILSLLEWLGSSPVFMAIGEFATWLLVRVLQGAIVGIFLVAAVFLCMIVLGM